VHLALGVTADTSVVTTEGNGLLVFKYVSKELLGLAQRHSSEVVGSLSGVLEVNAQVGATGGSG